MIIVINWLKINIQKKLQSWIKANTYQNNESKSDTNVAILRHFLVSLPDLAAASMHLCMLLLKYTMFDVTFYLSD